MVKLQNQLFYFDIEFRVIPILNDLVPGLRVYTTHGRSRVGRLLLLLVNDHIQ